MMAVQAPGGAQALIDRSEHHRIDRAEGAMELPDGICKRVGVLLNRSGDPGMSEL